MASEPKKDKTLKTVHLDPERHKKLKLRATEAGVSVKEYLAKLVDKDTKDSNK